MELMDTGQLDDGAHSLSWMPLTSPAPWWCNAECLITRTVTIRHYSFLSVPPLISLTISHFHLEVGVCGWVELYADLSLIPSVNHSFTTSPGLNWFPVLLYSFYMVITNLSGQKTLIYKKFTKHMPCKLTGNTDSLPNTFVLSAKWDELCFLTAIITSREFNKQLCHDHLVKNMSCLNRWVFSLGCNPLIIVLASYAEQIIHGPHHYTTVVTNRLKLKASGDMDQGFSNNSPGLQNQLPLKWSQWQE